MKTIRTITILLLAAGLLSRAAEVPRTILDLDWPFRKIGGTVYHAERAPGWRAFAGRTLQRFRPGLYLISLPRESGSVEIVMVQNFPLDLPDDAALPRWYGKFVGHTNYTTVLRSQSTISLYDYGQRVPRPAHIREPLPPRSPAWRY